MAIQDDGLVASLCTVLRTILAAELAAENRIERITGEPDGWPLVVVLSDPFRCFHGPPPQFDTAKSTIGTSGKPTTSTTVAKSSPADSAMNS